MMLAELEAFKFAQVKDKEQLVGIKIYSAISVMKGSTESKDEQIQFGYLKNVKTLTLKFHLT